MQKKVMVVDEKDKQVWDLVTDVPLVTKPIAVISAIFNLLIPGLGTMISACSAKESVSKTQMTVAVFQFLTSFVLIGYIMSWYWAYLICMKAWRSSNEVKRGLPARTDAMRGGFQS